MKTFRLPTLLRMKPKAIERIGKYLKQEGFDKVYIFWGKGIEPLFGERVRISCKKEGIIILKYETVMSQNGEDCFESATSLPREVKALVAIGGGLAIDYSKYIAHLTHLPCIAVPTIISNDGFCSSLSSLYIKGKRQTLKTIIPYGVVIDLEIIRNAPRIYLYSGMGDLFCKATALYDWKLAFKKSGVIYDDFAAILAQNTLDAFVFYDKKDPSDILFLRLLAGSLLMCGVMMEVAGSSRPASGSEHLISHAYDLVATQPSLHGIQVGVASYAVSLIQETTHQILSKAIEECGFLDFVEANPLSKKDFCEAIKKAPTIKADFYSVLSEKGSVARLLKFVEKDPLLSRMVQ
ncbi:MAG: iron-containing alcohol dehydrogenase family protein [Nitrospinae bacterium]|nr:iron-containing alcohol dehydrogenase family protein [Nitrospinota bacterium]